MKRLMHENAGFTMIELLVAMAVFSFMLLIIVVGFINIVRLHNQAIASNIAQDNARSALAELVRGVRDSAGVVTPAPGVPAHQLCLDNASGPQQLYYVNPVTKVLYRADNCASPTNAQALTSPSVQVSDFTATVKTSGANIVKPQVELSVTVATTGNNTTTGSGTTIACGPSNADRTFCSTVTLTSGAVPR
jgi:prepilin-type N-terminal cleavage/methylation domain-containing protein